MNPTVQLVLDILGALVRFVGLLAFGVGMGWLVLEFFRKGQQAWQLQIAIFLGFVVLVIAAASTLAPAALGGFGIGLAVAFFIWGFPKKKKNEEE
jgi:amino acid permease